MLAAALLALTLSADPSTDTNNSFDFDLMAPATALSPPPAAVDPHLGELAQKRRSMLRTHQILGLTTLGLMAATVAVGQLNYNDIYTPGGGHTGDFLVPKRMLGYSTFAAFLATGGFSLLAPEPYEKDEGFDTATLHKASVAMATVGMVSQVVLGFITGRTADAGNATHLQAMAKAHQVIGYSTLGLMTVAATVWLF